MGLFALQNFVFLILMARFVEKESHGIFVLANILVMFVTMLAESGAGAAIIQRKEVTRAHLSTAFYLNIVISATVYVLLVGFASAICEFYQGRLSPEILYVIGLNLIVANMGMVSRSLLIKELDFRPICIIQNGAYFISHLLLGVLMGVLGFGVWSFIFPSVLNNLFASASLYYKRPHSLKLYFRRQEFKEISYFGLSYTLVRVTHYVGFQIDKVLFGKFASLDSLANYEKAQTLSYLPGKVLGSAFDPVLFSVLTNARGETERVSRLFSGLSNALLLVMLYVSTILFFCSESVVLLVLGGGWIDSAPAVRIFALIVPFMVLSRISDVFVRSYNKMFHVLPIKVAYATAVGVTALNSRQMSAEEFAAAVATIFILFAIVMTCVAIRLAGVSIGRYLTGLKPTFICLPVLVIKLLLTDYLYRKTGYPLFYEALLVVAVDVLCLAAILFTWPGLLSRLKDTAALQPLFEKYKFLQRTHRK